MGFPWVDVVGPTVTNTLAKECAVDITPGLFRLLNLYGEHMDAIVSSLSEATSTAATDQQTLDNLLEVMQAELTEFRDTRHDQELEIEQLDVVQQQETRTPVVHCKLKALPLLVIEVTRAYAAHRVFVNPSWKASGTGYGKALGRAQTAVNHVTAVCKECKHQMSISGVLDIWFARGLGTPLSKQRTARPSEKSHSKVSQLSGKGEVYDLDTITLKGKSTSELSSYTSGESCETAWTPSEKGSSRKRISASRKTNYNYSRWSRKKRRDGPCVTVSSPPGPRPSGQLFPDHPLELSTPSPCSGLGQCLRPVTNAELRASVNAALNTSDTSRRKVSQLEAYDRQTVSGQTTLLGPELCSSAAEEIAITDSTKMVPSYGSKEANQCGPLGTNSIHANRAILAVASNGDRQSTCRYDAKALDNKLVANFGGTRGDFEGLPSQSTAVEAVNAAERGTNWTLANVQNLANGNGFEIDDILYELYAPSESEGEEVQAPSGANDLEEYIRNLD